MIIEFTSDGSVTYKGFRIEYKAIPEDTGECDVQVLTTLLSSHSVSGPFKGFYIEA